MAEQFTIRKAGGTWSIRAGGAVIGETDRALELVEGTRPPVIYIPRADIAMAFLERSDSHTHCPTKGDATYWSVITKSGTIRDAAWSYDAPTPAAEPIAGHIAFGSDQVAVERI